MKRKLYLASVLFVITGAFSTYAQSVTISPRKTVYRRPKPQYDHKRTFTIRRPIARAATPALSRKITAAISPEKVLDINIREEQTEYQWLEEADYKVLFNRDGILSIQQWMTGTAAYPDSVTKRVVVDLKSGNAIRISDVFKDLSNLAKLARKKQEAEIEAAKVEMKSDPDARPDELFSETNFTAEDFNEFSVDANGVTFYYDYGFPHVIEAWQPPGEYRFAWSEIRPFIRTDGLLARFVR
jgi:hypothetical protein